MGCGEADRVVRREEPEGRVLLDGVLVEREGHAGRQRVDVLAEREPVLRDGEQVRAPAVGCRRRDFGGGDHCYRVRGRRGAR